MTLKNDDKMIARAIWATGVQANTTKENYNKSASFGSFELIS